MAKCILRGRYPVCLRRGGEEWGGGGGDLRFQKMHCASILCAADLLSSRLKACLSKKHFILDVSMQQRQQILTGQPQTLFPK